MNERPTGDAEAEGQSPPPQDMRLPFAGWWPFLIGAASGVALRLVFSGRPGGAFSAMEASFIYLAPVLVGVVTVYVAESRSRRSWPYYFWSGFFANVLFVIGTLLIMIEGLICAILIAPLFGIFGGIAGLVAGLTCRLTRWPRHAVYSLAVIPVLLGVLEPLAPLPEQVRVLERKRMIAAPPQAIWQQLENARNIAPPEVEAAWMYRIGVPLPEAGVTEWTSCGPVRRITMGRGIHFDQVASEWEPNRHVRWTYRFAEDSFPPQALDDHVKIGGHYFDLRATEYTLTPSDSGTQLGIRMHYRVSTQFNWYAGAIADFLIGNFAEVVLGFYAHRAEARTPAINAPTS
jgi:hypothetical protein